LTLSISRKAADMPHRRDILVGGASAALALLAGVTGALAEPVSPRLETRLFNFKDDVSPEAAAEIVAKMKAFAASPGVGGFMIGRNFIPDPFPARFEWLYMIQFDAPGGGADPAVLRRFEALRGELSSLCRNEVQCDLTGPTPPRFADAAGVKVRHTVMFDFKPEASAEDQARNVEAIRTMGRLPMVKSYRVERSANSPSSPTQMQWQVIGDFASVQDFRAYSKAPVHLAIREDFTAHTARVAFLDVEL
jgi:hypothetical protein